MADSPTTPNSVTATIELTEGSPMPCILYYIVFYKRDADPNYVQLYPNPNSSPIVVNGLIENAVYNFKVQSQCCNGGLSDFVSFDVTTTIT